MVGTKLKSNKNILSRDKKEPKKDSNDLTTIPPFDLSTKNVGLGNISNRITVVIYKVKVHPANTSLLNIPFFQVFILDDSPSSNTVENTAE